MHIFIFGNRSHKFFPSHQLENQPLSNFLNNFIITLAEKYEGQDEEGQCKNRTANRAYTICPLPQFVLDGEVFECENIVPKHFES